LLTVPCGVLNEVLRPETSSKGAVEAESAMPSAPSDARIDIAIEDIDQQVDADIDDGAEHDEGLYHCVVLPQDAVDHQRADPRPGENPFHQHTAAQQLRED